MLFTISSWYLAMYTVSWCQFRACKQVMIFEHHGYLVFQSMDKHILTPSLLSSLIYTHVHMQVIIDFGSMWVIWIILSGESVSCISCTMLVLNLDNQAPIYRSFTEVGWSGCCTYPGRAAQCLQWLTVVCQCVVQVTIVVRQSRSLNSEWEDPTRHQDGECCSTNCISWLNLPWNTFSRWCQGQSDEIINTHFKAWADPCGRNITQYYDWGYSVSFSPQVISSYDAGFVKSECVSPLRKNINNL